MLDKEKAIKKIRLVSKLDKYSLLERFASALQDKNSQYNLIGKSTIANLWERHFLDCAQLIEFIDDKNAKFVDLGSGAGLPGIILSILGVKNISLVEKSYRKSEFLRQIKIDLELPFSVYQKNIEELDKSKKFDCITSRALAPLTKLLGFATDILSSNGYCLFLKGKKLDLEISEARKNFDFELKTFPSCTSNEGRIVKINKIRKI